MREIIRNMATRSERLEFLFSIEINSLRTASAVIEQAFFRAKASARRRPIIGQFGGGIMVARSRAEANYCTASSGRLSGWCKTSITP